MDHDQRFKILIQTFFLEFLLLFFKEWAERLDATAVEWLDKEVFLDPPDGPRRVLDLVGKLPPRRRCQDKGQANRTNGLPWCTLRLNLRTGWRRFRAHV